MMADPLVIDARYLLVLNVRLMRRDDGVYFADRSWAKDLMKHTAYLSNLSYAAPVVSAAPAKDWVALDQRDLRIVPLPAGDDAGGFLRGLPKLVANLWREIGKADVVHTGVAGHPVPMGWLAIPMARLRGKRVVVSFESAFWRISEGDTPSTKRRLRANLWENINRAMMGMVHHAFYTHTRYEEAIPARRALTSVISPASWIDEDIVQPVDVVERRWADLIASGRRPRFLFAARMIKEKGTDVMLAAIERLAERDADVVIDIIGDGPEMKGLVDRSQRGWGSDHLNILAPVPYGPEFFALLSNYDAILVPNLSDEQPRIVYDSFSQGVPVIGSDLAGIRSCVEGGRTGKLIEAGNAEALADAIVDVGSNRARSRDWGLEGRDVAGRSTHDQMHRERAAVLYPHFQQLTDVRKRAQARVGV